MNAFIYEINLRHLHILNPAIVISEAKPDALGGSSSNYMEVIRRGIIRANSMSLHYPFSAALWKYAKL